MPVAYSTLFFGSAKKVGKDEAEKVIDEIKNKKIAGQYTEKDESDLFILINDAFYNVILIQEQIPKNILTYEAQCALSYAQTLKAYKDDCQKNSLSSYKFQI